MRHTLVHARAQRGSPTAPPPRPGLGRDQELFDARAAGSPRHHGGANAHPDPHGAETDAALWAHPPDQGSCCPAKTGGDEARRVHEDGRPPPGPAPECWPGIPVARRQTTSACPLQSPRSRWPRLPEPPLLRDEYQFTLGGRARADPTRGACRDVLRPAPGPAMERGPSRARLYFVGIDEPGRVTLHNYPRVMQRRRSRSSRKRREITTSPPLEHLPAHAGARRAPALQRVPPAPPQAPR